MVDPVVWDIGYLMSAALFILGIKRLSSPRTAPQGNRLGAYGMLLAVLVTMAKLYSEELIGIELIAGGLIIGSVIGAWLAIRVEMTGMPELVALFNGFGGGASALVGFSEVLDRLDKGNVPDAGVELYATWIAIGLSGLVGWLTLTGSLMAMGKLMGGFYIPFTKKDDRGRRKWVNFPTWGPPWLNFVKGLLLIASLALIVLTIQEPGNKDYVFYLVGTSSMLGVLFVLPIGGADMPVVVSLLNSLSGIAAAFTGFVIGNNVLIIAGSMVGAAGLILTFIMCKAMNRTLPAVLFKSFGGGGKETVTRTKVGSDPEEVAMVCDGISKCVIIPGYGMAVSQAQHAVKEFADLLEAEGVEVSYGIHPVAGRMPGHMNVLLAEANVPYEQLIEMDEINSELPECDVALVIGANDTVNPVARSGEGPLGGMPIIDADKARVVVIIKRSLSVGYAGVDNDLFYEDKTMMLFGDGKKMMNELNSAFKDL
ncbi:MAG: NAD(P)(+) transhydrogenase (Re/Si-specific) subunit beta [Candidatus Thermoplasmatota archaeon]|nr:NAD synthetase [Euryarchaeota archaeon]MEC7704464.1 NAD(P)(+) transhydrogenase (Re/Si-specific) subunit beta [Candidatus Thermoplasmatota archaeon]MEC9090758.1 NAD(P)(+) transhydrogenase (Re/Si-specific) subunit beta [Candidatus Thermoplasmatota archaeon]MED5486307.1 NAD(P)(+) transhydrogenase (Re/Si-specific) subunit beta [Candidatus Thermoplasmatota archaeon]